MRITLRYFEDCPNWQVLDERLRALTAGRADVEIAHELISTTQDAERLGFVGSPTLLIDGVDPFAEPGRPAGLTCRIYQTPEGPAGSPTIEQLTPLLARIANVTRRV
jgi:hypothetical protein